MRVDLSMHVTHIIQNRCWDSHDGVQSRSSLKFIVDSWSRVCIIISFDETELYLVRNDKTQFIIIKQTELWIKCSLKLLLRETYQIQIGLIGVCEGIRRVNGECDAIRKDRQ